MYVCQWTDLSKITFINNQLHVWNVSTLKWDAQYTYRVRDSFVMTTYALIRNRNATTLYLGNVRIVQVVTDRLVFLNCYMDSCIISVQGNIYQDTVTKMHRLLIDM